jgi:hypothetical protein
MKLKTETFTYVTSDTKESITLEISVSKEGQFFFSSRDIPSETWSIIEDKLREDCSLSLGHHQKRGEEYSQYYLVRHPSLKELLSAFQRALEFFEESQTERDELKVIRYSFGLGGIGERRDSLHINFKWEILRQLTNKSKVRRWNEGDVIFLDDRGDSRAVDKDEDKLIEWTPEREAWFENMEKQMRDLMEKLQSFMALKEKHVEKMIDSGTLLLTGAN